MFKVVDAVQVNDLLIAELLELDTGKRRLRLRPVNPSVYFRTHTKVDLTLRELDLIVTMVHRNPKEN